MFTIIVAVAVHGASLVCDFKFVDIKTVSNDHSFRVVCSNTAIVGGAAVNYYSYPLTILSGLAVGQMMNQLASEGLANNKQVRISYYPAPRTQACGSQSNCREAYAVRLIN